MEEETNWDYSSEEKKLGTNTRTAHSFSWTASEYIDHERGSGWFAMLAVSTIIIAGVIYLVSRDYFAAGIIIILGITVGAFARRPPRKLQYEVSAEGIKIEDKLYPLAHYKSFSVVQEGPISSLVLTPLKRFMPPLSVYFETMQQAKIMSVLEDRLPYEEGELDFADRLSRRLRF